jgi:hypothetical protein
MQLLKKYSAYFLRPLYENPILLTLDRHVANSEFSMSGCNGSDASLYSLLRPTLLCLNIKVLSLNFLRSEAPARETN